MNKTLSYFVLSFLCMLLLCACTSDSIKPSVTLTLNYPSTLPSKSDPSKPIQLFYESEHTAYMMYTSHHSARALVSQQENTLTIHLQTDTEIQATSVTNSQVFKLSIPPSTDTLAIEIDGKPTHFDSIHSLSNYSL